MKIKKLFCKHEYEYTSYIRMVEGGMGKLYECTCKKCGKKKRKIV